MPGRPTPAARPVNPSEVTDFATLYSQNCAGCHGRNGHFGGALPLNNPAYLAIVDDASMHEGAANGIAGTSMPAFAIGSGGMLTDQQITIIVNGIRSRWGSGQPAFSGAPPYASQTEGDPTHGAKLYGDYCASCHGNNGTGEPAGAIDDPSFLALYNNQALRTLIIAGRPDLGHPGWRDYVGKAPLNSAQVSDLVAWLAANAGREPPQNRTRADLHHDGRAGRVQNRTTMSESPETATDESRQTAEASRAATSNRRSFLLRAALLLNALVLAAFAIPIAGYLLAPLRRAGFLKWISLGPIGSFPENQTRLAVYTNPFRTPWDGTTVEIPCWVRRLNGDSFQVFATNCSHLGCPVRWFPESELFMCPCHGGTFHADGERASGPPPRALYQYPYKVNNGELWVKAGEMPLMTSPKA